MVTHAIFSRSSALAVNEDVNELADGLDLLLALFEDTNFVCYRTLAKLVYP
jgi:hypothetical protein